MGKYSHFLGKIVTTGKFLRTFFVPGLISSLPLVGSYSPGNSLATKKQRHEEKIELRGFAP